MRLVGYSNRLSVAPGETIDFMVSSAHAAYEAEIVRLVHGDPNPLGPGLVEHNVETPVRGRYPGRNREYPHRFSYHCRRWTVGAIHQQFHVPGLDLPNDT